MQYFSDDATVLARGEVRVTLPDGATASGDAFAMDLRLRRLLVAGHVHLSTPDGAYDGAAVADFLAYRRVYFIPLEPQADRWTFRNGDYSKPAKGLDMPGDVFYFPDLRGHRPYITGRRAVIDASTYVEFEPATAAILMGPDTPKLPSFVDNYSANPAFGQNSLAGATFDAPYQFEAGAHTLEALHFRYDQAIADPYFLSFEHHSVADDGAYAVFSLNPMTQYAKQWTLLGYAPSGARGAFSLDAQLFTTQHDLAQPSGANGFVDLQFIHALRQSSVLVDATQSYDSLLGNPVQPNHAFISGLQWSGYEQPIFRSGFTFRVASGAAWVHDAFGVSGKPQPNITMEDLSATLATPQLPGPFGSSLSATASDQRTWLSFPNQIASQSLVVSDGKLLAPKVYGVLSGLVQSVRTNDPALAVISPNAATGLVAQPASPNGLPVLGVPTTTTAAVERDYTAALSWQPNPAFQFAASDSRIFYAPGQPMAPTQLALSARADVTRTLFVTIGRIYYFDWQRQAWSPRFSFQVSAQ